MRKGNGQNCRFGRTFRPKPSGVFSVPGSEPPGFKGIEVVEVGVHETQIGDLHDNVGARDKVRPIILRTIKAG